MLNHCLLVAPRTVNTIGEYYEFPLGLAYISSALKTAGYTVTCLNLNQKRGGVKKLMEELSADVDVVMTGGLSIHYNQVAEIIHIAKALQKITVLGGGILTSNPLVAFQALKPDCGVLFEGEESTVGVMDFFNHKTQKPPKGLMLWSEGKPYCTGTPEPLDVDRLSYADYAGFNADEYVDNQFTSDSRFFYAFDKPRVLPMISSRSCPYNCSFCHHPLGKVYRRRSIRNFFDEVKLLQARFRLNMILVYDELFASDDKWLREFCAEIKATGLKWLAQFRVDCNLNDETIRMLKDSGLLCFAFGLESHSNEVLMSMRKHITVSQMDRMLALAWKHKVGIQGNFIFGDCAESQETVKETLSWYLKYRHYQIALTPIYIYAGSPLYKIAVDRGLVKDELVHLKTKYPIINLTKLSDEEYHVLLGELEKLNVETHRIYQAKILKCQVKKRTSHGASYDLRVECPFCHSINHFSLFNYNPRVELDYLGSLSACRVCNQRFTMFIPSVTRTIFNHLPIPVYAMLSSLKRKAYQKFSSC